MKQITHIATALALVWLTACASLEKNSYVAIGATTTAVELARQAYIQHANDCHCVTQSEFEKVNGYYDKYQAAMKVAQDAITAYKSASVPNQSALTAAIDAAAASASDVIALVESLLPASDNAKLKTKLPKESRAH